MMVLAPNRSAKTGTANLVMVLITVSVMYTATAVPFAKLAPPSSVAIATSRIRIMLCPAQPQKCIPTRFQKAEVLCACFRNTLVRTLAMSLFCMLRMGSSSGAPH